MAEHIRVGVVGTSWFADGFHLPNLASHPRAEITAICGRTRERAEELATKYTIPNVFTDYRAMIASGMLDAWWSSRLTRCIIQSRSPPWMLGYMSCVRRLWQ